MLSTTLTFWPKIILLMVYFDLILIMKTKSKEVANQIKISYQILADGFKIIALNDNFFVKYPKEIFSQLSMATKKSLAENFIYCRTATLNLATNLETVYQFPKPIIKNFIETQIIKDLPRVSFFNKIPTAKLIKANTQAKKIFQSGKTELILPASKTSNQKAILALSFGKDSILTYGLAKEIGLDFKIAYVNEMEDHNAAEYRFKNPLIKKFSHEQKVKINYLTENADDVFFTKKIKIEELDNTNGMSGFVLELIPFAYNFNARYIILGNEKNFDDSFKTPDGYIAYPSTDQTTKYTFQENKTLKKLSNDNLEIMSLVEPIYNLAEMRVLYHRYPHLLKYIMSCSLDTESGDRWCYNCPMCAKAFLYSAAVNGDPKKIGIKKNLFEKKYQKLYPLFAKKITRAYEKPPAVRDEQLLSFLLASQNGFKGELIDLFKKKYLAEAKKREKELKKKFFKIYPAPNIPKIIKDKIFKIYQEELKDFYEKQ